MKKRRRLPSEHEIQCAFIERVRASYKTYPSLSLLFAVPNGAKRSPALARYMRLEGMRAGVCDIMFPVARGQWHGFAIEFKSHGRKPTPEQTEFIGMLRAEGWQVHVLDDWEIAWKRLIDYLENNNVRTPI